MSERREYQQQLRSYARRANLVMLTMATPALLWSGGWLPLENPGLLAVPVFVGGILLARMRARLHCPACKEPIPSGQGGQALCPSCGVQIL